MIQVDFYFGNHLAADWLAQRLARQRGTGGATVTDTKGLWLDPETDALEREPGAKVTVIGSPTDDELAMWKSLASSAAQRWGEKTVLVTVTHLIDSELVTV